MPYFKKQKKIIRNKYALIFHFLSFFAITQQITGIDFKNPVHGYHEITPNDPFSKFIERIKKGEVELNYGSDLLYLRSLLEELGISPHSQLLVYSTTSLQLNRISPSNPRALYFSDDVYLGFVPGGQIEIIGIDPQLGAIPYIFNLPRLNETKHPTIYRSKRCMNCHASHEIGGAPALLLGSVIPGPGGGTIDAFRRNKFGHTIPYEKRFGGWHITGKNPFLNSWSNQIGMIKNEQIIKIPNPPGKHFSWNNYLVESSSVIPHLLLEHQVGFTNLCVSATYQFRELKDSKEDFINEQADLLLSYILFENEAKLPESKITPSGNYVIHFENNKDRHGLNAPSLRKLNLNKRIFDLRCSYMIFSNSFIGLPEPIKNLISEKLFNILTSEQDKIPTQFSYLQNEERQKIKNILAAKWKGFHQK